MLTDRFRPGAPDECWPWLGRIDRDGYGTYLKTTAQRAVYSALVGPIPEGLTLDHLCHGRDRQCPGGKECRHRRCVNPVHLEPVTNRENILRGGGLSAIAARRDSCAKGHAYTPENVRFLRGERLCRPCDRDRAARYKARKRSARP